MNKKIGITGLKLWNKRVQTVYSSLEELQKWDDLYGISLRCGYDNAEELWDANPMLQGSMHPNDFGLATK